MQSSGIVGAYYVPHELNAASKSRQNQPICGRAPISSEIIMPEEHEGQVGEEYAWKKVLRMDKAIGACPIGARAGCASAPWTHSQRVAHCVLRRANKRPDGAEHHQRTRCRSVYVVVAAALRCPRALGRRAGRTRPDCARAVRPAQHCHHRCLLPHAAGRGAHSTQTAACNLRERVPNNHHAKRHSPRHQGCVWMHSWQRCRGRQASAGR